jgi:hypothetical protein
MGFPRPALDLDARATRPTQNESMHLNQRYVCMMMIMKIVHRICDVFEAPSGSKGMNVDMFFVQE